MCQRNPKGFRSRRRKMSIFKDRMGQELTLGEATPKIFNRFFNIWLDFELMLLRWVGHLPLHFVRRGVYRLAGVKIGRASTIHLGCNFFYPPGVEVGQGTIIGDHCFLDGRAPLKIGSHVDIASQVLIYNSQHDLHSEDFHPIEAPVTIDDYVFIGPRAVILPGVKIGKGAVVAAGAVVTKDVAPKKIVGGVPAQEIGERKVHDFHYRLGRARLFQ
jgi:acetyltransferase-like isoleucine patch superfamily enzyme